MVGRLVCEAHRLARQVAAEAADPRVHVSGDDLAVAAANIRARMRGGIDDPHAAGALGAALTELALAHRTLRRRAITRRIGSITRINAALATLRMTATPSGLMPAAAEQLATCFELDRVVVWRLDGQTLEAQGVWATPETDLDELGGASIRLGPDCLEGDLIRRQAPAFVSPEHVRDDDVWASRLHSDGYLVSPIVAARRVVGFVHADRCAGAPLSDIDAQELWRFALGPGVLVERTALIERIAEQRAHVREALGEAEVHLRALGEDELRLSRDGGPAADRSRQPVPGELRDLFTPRERDVMVAMASGARNAQIAEQLSLSETTVKTHVATILRKLGAATRAEAVSRYLTLVLERRA